MSKESTATSGANTDTSGSESINTKETEKTSDTPLEVKLKREKDNVLKAKQLVEGENAKLLARIQELETLSLSEKEQYKTLYEREKEARELVIKELTSHKEKEVEGKKLSAIKKELFKLGLDPKFEEAALKLVDKKSIVVDQATDTIIGADEIAKQFHQNYGSLGFFSKAGSFANHTAAAAGPLKVDLSKMSVEQKLAALRQQKR